MTQKKTLIDTKNAASILGVSTATVRNWIKASLLTVIPLQRIYLDRTEVEQLKKKIAQKKLTRLTGRANKSKAAAHFIPAEYFSDPNSVRPIRVIVEYAARERVPLGSLLFGISMNWLVKEGIACKPSPEALEKGDLQISNLRIREEMLSWNKELRTHGNEKEYSFLWSCPLPDERDFLGLLYQSLLSAGKKSRQGSYYTPRKIVRDIVQQCVRPHHRVLDPCCGTGQFLLEFAEVVKDPRQIQGFDSDKIAVRIARLNLLMRFREYDFEPNIFFRDVLLTTGADPCLQDGERFEVIATNPPWGFHYSGAEKKKINALYPRIQSMESYSLFLSRCIGLLEEGGRLSFLLPESILQVGIHRDIRKEILERTRILRICGLGVAFKNVFTPVIRLDLEKRRGNPEKDTVQVSFDGKEYTCAVSGWKNDEECRFTIQLDGFSSGILEKVYSKPCTTLRGKADWALGVVTGNNAQYVKSVPSEGLREIYAGKDVQRYRLSPPSRYIHFNPKAFQQVAPLERYFSPEKLIYRFVSNRLIFAYDDRQRLTLNSANVLIPRVSEYPMKLILGLFNSSLYQFLYQKKFSGVKVLRSYLEELPLPLLTRAERTAMLRLVEAVLTGSEDGLRLDSYVFSLFSLTPEEKQYVIETIK